METPKSYIDKRVFAGAALIFVGAVLIIEKLGIINNVVFDFIISWQMLLIFIGLLNLLHYNNPKAGAICLGIGILFIIPKIFNISFDFHDIFFPALLVGIGVLILFKRHKHDKWNECQQQWREKHKTRWEYREGANYWCSDPTTSNTESTSFNSAEYINDFNFFSGAERRSDVKTFRGGKVTSVFGGAKYDLTGCNLADGESILEVVNIFGGINIIVPPEWKIHIDVVAVFGGFADKRRNLNFSGDSSNKILRIKGVAIFGGGEIKSL